MLLPRESVLSADLNRLVLLLPVLVVPVPVQLSPPAMNTLPLDGNTICELQKNVGQFKLSRVRWPAARPCPGPRCQTKYAGLLTGLPGPVW